VKTSEIIYKDVGETPLQALERYRAAHPELAGMPMTYAGRLDPMAEGELLILIGDECKDKARWLDLDKEYEVEIALGIQTDTYDALGLAVLGQNLSQNAYRLADHVGRFIQEYPPYSSKAFSWKGDEPPTKEVEIYSIELLEQGSISAVDMKHRIFSMIDRVKGDFRQEEIKQRWDEILTDQIFPTFKIRVKCSSGTYMRSLAHRMGGFALAIKRTRIFMDKAA
jgi:tRNA pseudouridine55 synthase